MIIIIGNIVKFIVPKVTLSFIRSTSCFVYWIFLEWGQNFDQESNNEVFHQKFPVFRKKCEFFLMIFENKTKVNQLQILSHFRFPLISERTYLVTHWIIHLNFWQVYFSLLFKEIISYQSFLHQVNLYIY